MNKNELRKIYIDKRKSLDKLECTKLDDLLLIQFQKVQLPFFSTLLSYWPIEDYNEPNTHLFTDYLEFRNPGLLVAYPKMDYFMDEIVALSTYIGTNFLKNDFNIYEPEAGNRVPANEIDIILVPLLAIDKKGFRVGFGKGYYDKFLAESREDCIKVGFSYFEPINEIADKADFDVPLNLCITPQSVYVF